MSLGWSLKRLRACLVDWFLLACLLGAVAGGLALLGHPGFTRLGSDFLILCALVVALQTFVGNSGIVSFGHVAFFGIGAYAAALVTIPPAIKAAALPHLPLLLQGLHGGLGVACLAGAAVAGLMALGTGLALARMSEGAMAMATLALLVMLHSVFANWESVTRGTIGVYGIPRNITLLNLAASVMLISGLAMLFKASPTGLRLQATRDDPLAARSLGVNVARVRLAGWGLSACLMGAGGALWAQNNLAFGPNQFYYAETFTLLSMLVIGGLGSVTGACTGAAVVTVVSELLRSLENGLRIGSWLELPELPGIAQMTIALLIMVILILRPGGLLGQKELSALRPRLGRRE